MNRIGNKLSVVGFWVFYYPVARENDFKLTSRAMRIDMWRNEIREI